MTARERILTAIRHREPDRVPCNLRPGPEIMARFHAETGSDDFAGYFGHDVRYVRLELPPKPDDIPADQWTPVPGRAAVASAARAAEELKASGFAVCSSYVCGIYEQAKHWLGDEAAMVAVYEDPAGFRTVLDRIEEWKGELYAAYAAAGVDLLWMGDDLGAQRSLVMSPATYREWYRPRHERIVRLVRSVGPEVGVVFHSCGHVTPLVPDLIDLGVDVLEAVQQEAMDIGALKRDYGRDITFWGGVGAQSALHLPVGEMTEAIRRTLSVMAPGGGYIAAPCHTLTEEVPWENVVAFHDALRLYGAYPHPGEPSPKASTSPKGPWPPRFGPRSGTWKQAAGAPSSPPRSAWEPRSKVGAAQRSSRETRDCGWFAKTGSRSAATALLHAFMHAGVHSCGGGHLPAPLGHVFQMCRFPETADSISHGSIARLINACAAMQGPRLRPPAR
jgi:hypothetical protein